MRIVNQLFPPTNRFDNLDSKFFQQFTVQRLFNAFTCLNFAPWKLPEFRIHLALGTRSQQKITGRSNQHADGDLHHRTISTTLTSLVRVGQLMGDFDRISELDINPLIAGPAQIGNAVADVRIRLSDPS